MRRSLRAGMIVPLRHLLAVPVSTRHIRRKTITREKPVYQSLGNTDVPARHRPSTCAKHAKNIKSKQSGKFSAHQQITDQPTAGLVQTVGMQLPVATGAGLLPSAWAQRGDKALRQVCHCAIRLKHFTCRQIAPQAVTRQKAVFQAVSG